MQLRRYRDASFSGRQAVGLGGSRLRVCWVGKDCLRRAFPLRQRPACREDCLIIPRAPSG